MNAQERQQPRFLGRPEGARPGFVPGSPGVAGRSGSRASRLWLIQALTGAALLVLLGVHLVAQHLLAPEGLRDYAAVVAYLRQPAAIVAEIGLVVSVILHAALGTRSTLVDVIRDEAVLRRVSIGIGVVGVIATAYAVWLTAMLVSAAS